MAEPIIIDIQNYVRVNGGSGGANPVKESAEKAASGSSELDKAAQTLNVMTLVRAFGRLGIAISGSNDEIRQAVQIVQKSIRYGSLAARAVTGMATGDYTQAALLALMISADALTTAQQAAAKVASSNNSADAAAIQAGILDIENANITNNWWDGRHSYSGR